MSRASVAVGFRCWIAIWTISLIFLVNSALTARTVTVEEGGRYDSVAEGIEMAQDGDTVLVKPGFYKESDLQIKKSIVLTGEDGAIIDGSGEGAILTVSADDVEILDLTFRGAGVSFVEDNAAVRLESVSDCSVVGCTFLDNFFAVYLASAARCRVANNVIKGAAESETTSANGIHLWYCREVVVEDNEVDHHRDGIYFEFVVESTIQRNYSHHNLRYGLHFMYSDSCEYRNNRFERNGSGVAVMYTDNVVMSENTFSDNWGISSYGLLLKDIRDSRVEGNLFERNTIGIHAEGSSRVVISGNTFSQNGWGMKMLASSIDNTIKRNNFLNNTFQVATNSRQSYSIFESNFWSDYAGFDLDNDGFGDIPHRPVTLFSMEVEREPLSLVLLRSPFVELLNLAERVMPVITPQALEDSTPLMEPVS